MNNPKYDNISNDKLLVLVEELAIKKKDGHVSIMRFTGGWKVFLGTPDLRSGDGDEQVAGQKVHKELRNGLIYLLENPDNSIY
jgi:hypothetical protein